MAKKPKEDSVENYLVKQVKKLLPVGTQIHKYEIRRSEPDRIILLKGGRAVFIETKRPGKDLREEQERAQKRLIELGFDCFMCNNKADVDAVIIHLLEILK